jgi:hypothetical protein
MSDKTKAEAMSFVTRDWSIQNVLASVVKVSDFLISDVTKKRRFVEQRQNKLRIIDGERAQQ